MVPGWMNYVGASLLILAGLFLYSNPADTDLPTAETPILALPMVVAGLVWGALAIRKTLTGAEGHGERRREDN